jgi:tryptophan synthase alpha chain
MSRIDDVFARLRASGQTGLITYVTAGDPDIGRSRAVLEALDRAGADVLEVGVPFSDPMADGPVIQRATERALAAGTTLNGVLAMVAEARSTLRAPVVLFAYANPIARMGFDRFAREAAAAGVDGVLALDLPVEEAGECRARLVAQGVDPIFLLSPTTAVARIRTAASLGRGFLYGISRLGVTGARETLAEGARAMAARIRAETTMPLAIGFGISHPDHVAEVGQWADAAVVGSGLVNVVAEHGTRDTLVPAVEAYVRWLKGVAAAPAGHAVSW